MAAALREAGHAEIAAALERKSLAGQLRKAGRDDLADSLEAGELTPAVEEAQPPPPSRTSGSPSNSTKPRSDGTRSEGRMATKPRKTAHAQLDELRQLAAAERIKRRDLEAQLPPPSSTSSSTRPPSRTGTRPRTSAPSPAHARPKQAAIAKAGELRHQVDGAGLRVERAQADVDSFERDHARDLLAERERSARTVTLELAANVAETLRLAKVYVSERQAVDRLVAVVPGATPRHDGPAPQHPWEPALKALEPAVQRDTRAGAAPAHLAGNRATSRAGPGPSPRRPERKRQLTSAEQAELETLNADRGPAHAIAMASEQ